MYAIVESGGKQYKVFPGKRTRVDLMGVEPGSKVELDRILIIADGQNTLVGNPAIEGAKIVASCISEEKGDKVIAFKYKAKNRYRRKIGHRQPYTHLAIEKIILPSGEEFSAPVKATPKAEESGPAEAEEVKGNGS